MRRSRLSRSGWKLIHTSKDAWINEQQDRVLAVGFGYTVGNKEQMKRPHTVFTYPIHRDVKRIKSWRFAAKKQAMSFAKKRMN